MLLCMLGSYSFHLLAFLRIVFKKFNNNFTTDIFLEMAQNILKKQLRVFVKRLV